MLVSYLTRSILPKRAMTTSLISWKRIPRSIVSLVRVWRFCDVSFLHDLREELKQSMHLLPAWKTKLRNADFSRWTPDSSDNMNALFAIVLSEESGAIKYVLVCFKKQTFGWQKLSLYVEQAKQAQVKWNYWRHRACITCFQAHLPLYKWRKYSLLKLEKYTCLILVHLKMLLEILAKHSIRSSFPTLIVQQDNTEWEKLPIHCRFYNMFRPSKLILKEDVSRKKDSEIFNQIWGNLEISSQLKEHPKERRQRRY